MLNKSTLFSNFNASKSIYETGRLNRALGLAQRTAYEPKYDTTLTTCSCPDFWYRRIRCKHIISLALKGAV